MASQHPVRPPAEPGGRRFARRLGLFCSAWLLAAAVARGQAEPLPKERDLNETIVVGTSEAFFPYQFRDTDGQLKGFSNDVLDAVVRVMHLSIRRVTVNNLEFAGALRDGRVDMLQFWSETDERRTWAEFSVPIIGGIETVAVVRKDDKRIKRLNDLNGLRVAVGQRGNVGWRYLTTEQPRAQIVYTENTEQFLRQLADGKIDAAVMSRLTAHSMIERYKLANLMVLDDRIPGRNYDVRYCFTVRKGDALLLARLNEGLAILHRTGQFDEIYHRWFGRYEARTFKPIEVVSYVAAALALACIAATWGFVRQKTLSRRIARQAAELAEQRSLLAALHEKHPLATVILELAPGGQIALVSANGEALRLFGLAAPATLPCPLSQLGLAPEFRAYLDDALQRWNDPAQPRQWEARIAGSQRIWEATLVPLGLAETGMQRLCVLSNDVTQRRALDREIAQSRRLRALGELVGGIAHEFNNLLTPVILTTTQAQLGPVHDPEAQSHFAVIDKAARRAAELTRRLLTFGRKSDERAHPVRFAEVVENCRALLNPTMDRRIEWQTDIPAHLGPVNFNPTDLNQIVFNLVINARDALVEKLALAHDSAWTPRLRVAVQALPGDAQPSRGGPLPAAWQRLTVEDNGTGIAPEIVDRIFEPFFTTKEVGRGTGLGLATVWHLVTEAGGSIAVESKPGAGTKLHVFLPAETAAVAGGPTAPVPLPGGPRPVGCRALLVEDEPLVAQAAAAILRRAGHTVTHYTDGAEAWAHLERTRENFDVLFADVNMPRMSGIDLVRRVRSASLPGAIVVMGGRVTEQERRALHELHVDRILAKPFSAEELLAALEQARAQPAGT